MFIVNEIRKSIYVKTMYYLVLIDDKGNKIQERLNYNHSVKLPSKVSKTVKDLVVGDKLISY